MKPEILVWYDSEIVEERYILLEISLGDLGWLDLRGDGRFSVSYACRFSPEEYSVFDRRCGWRLL